MKSRCSQRKLCLTQATSPHLRNRKKFLLRFPCLFLAGCDLQSSFNRFGIFLGLDPLGKQILFLLATGIPHAGHFRVVLDLIFAEPSKSHIGLPVGRTVHSSCNRGAGLDRARWKCSCWRGSRGRGICRQCLRQTNLLSGLRCFNVTLSLTRFLIYVDGFHGRKSLLAIIFNLRSVSKPSNQAA